ELYPDWDDVANTTVALLRTEAGRDPLDRDLPGLVGELAATSPQFRTRWAAHDVQLHHTGVKRLRHPVVGLIEVAYTTMDLPAQARAALLPRRARFPLRRRAQASGQLGRHHPRKRPPQRRPADTRRGRPRPLHPNPNTRCRDHAARCRPHPAGCWSRSVMVRA